MHPGPAFNTDLVFLAVVFRVDLESFTILVLSFGLISQFSDCKIIRMMKV